MSKKEKPACFIILTPGFAANENDSSTLPFAQSFVLSFKKLYPQIKLIIISFQYPYSTVEYYWNNVQVIPLGGANRAGLHRKFIWLKAFLVITRLHYTYTIKGMFSFWLTECALVGQYAAKFYKINQISWMLGQDAKPTNKLLKLLNLNKNTVIALSPNLITELSRSFPVKEIQVIPSGINTKYFDAISANIIGYDILGVGSLIELKNYTLFIELIAALKESKPNIKAAIIGSGPKEKELLIEINEKGLQKNIALKGLLSHQTVISIMKASGIFLHTSNYEGQAAVFGEALYCGMQVVSFDVGRLHSNENMFVCENRDKMFKVLTQILAIETVERKQILLQSMDDTVEQVINLF